MFPQPWIFLIATIIAISLFMSSLVESFPVADKVKSLPEQSPVSFQQFAGFVPVDDKNQRALFYYFVEAETNPASKPLVLWLNGGPGCTSVGVGAFTEHGPFVTNQGEAIEKNQYSWNKEANILYLESPAGVGFSYSLNLSFYKTLNDEITGHYVPQLAELIIKSKVNFNLKGIAIGNPLLDFDTDMNAVDEYYWSHGIISDYAYKIRTSLCNSSRVLREYFSGQISKDCLVAAQKVSEEYSFTNFIDPYYVVGEKCLSYNVSQAGFLRETLNSGMFQFRNSHYVLQTEEPDQVGGWTKVYGNHLTYTTIRGASHGTPATQPKRSFVLFNAFLQGKPLPKA
ncbi:hypothetical protein JHK85_007523 [Glycine max]|nr:hypothetical protein JHK85_007523 [Glycine max]